MTIIDNNTTDWKTVTVTTGSDTSNISQNQSPVQQHQHNLQIHTSRRPTDQLEEFFYEQAKFFRHLERKYDRFNQRSREAERYARAGKFKHRTKPTPEQIEPHRQQQQQKQQQQAKQAPIYGPYTLEQQQASDQRRAQRQASKRSRVQRQEQTSGSTQEKKDTSARNSQGEELKGK